MSVVETLLSVERPPPCIPVRVSQDADGRWKKEPLAKWDCATTKRDMLEEWWLSWPDARPGIPLERVGWAVIDLDDYEDTAFRAAWVKPEKVVTRKGRSFIEPEHYSIYKTPSGGRHIVFAQPDPPLAGRMRWSPGVEVLGLGCLLTVYDVNAILYPRVAQRAVLPEVFRRPYAGKDAGRSHVYPRIKRSAPRDVAVVDVDVTNATAALWKMDPCDWRGDYDGWFHLAGACKAIGISRREFAKWSAGDPRYAADGRTVERIWESAKGAHGGAFYAALAARRIKVSAKRSLYPGVHISAGVGPSRVGNLQSRSHGVVVWLGRNATGDGLFSAACLLAEIGRTQDAATKTIDGNLPRLRRALGEAEFDRQIARAYAHVFSKLKEPQS